MSGRHRIRSSHAASRSTRGWATSAPKTREDRRKLYDRCGAKAFLMPNHADPGKSKFPIMGKRGACVPDCRALRIAETRAHQYRHPGAFRKAHAMGKRARCHWAV